MQIKYRYWAAILLLTAGFAVFGPDLAMAQTDPCASGGSDAGFDASVTNYRNIVAQQQAIASTNAMASVPTAPASNFQSNCITKAIDQLGEIPSWNNPISAIESAAKGIVSNLESASCAEAAGFVSGIQNGAESVGICFPFPNPSINGYTPPGGSCISIAGGGMQINAISGYNPPSATNGNYGASNYMQEPVWGQAGGM